MAVESYVVVHNIAKRHNVGTLARSATAFGVSELILVGRRERKIVIFAALRSLMMLCLSITTLLPRAPLFFFGNEGTGLSAKELEICDFFVYIPQYGSGTASLNVTVAASIVLHQFGVWAGFPERTRDGNKFIVAEKPVNRQDEVFVQKQQIL
ncbi:uncharacterized protein Pyn_32402 [Prunus yedoensis var. nudiflora]|uniref:tRNA/rRNA methyltransferase SpoU type domain-containing protein n=1 Tax=Prunus yedoensis var. nudiflora TaxID=2094558 RepID=A0A314U9J7_PRUYE|nr:uncharacterized protein Pyn_32402 [Prunus yedoensis var. nudiflora]